MRKKLAEHGIDADAIRKALKFYIHQHTELLETGAFNTNQANRVRYNITNAKLFRLLLKRTKLIS